jgi:hypothetical protein
VVSNNCGALITSLDLSVAFDNAFPTSDKHDRIIRNTLVKTARALGPDWDDIKARLKVDHDYVNILANPVSLASAFPAVTYCLAGTR